MNRLGELRRSLGMTRAELGRRIGYCPGAVKQWETGRRMPGAEALGLLELELGISEHEITVICATSKEQRRVAGAQR